MEISSPSSEEYESLGLDEDTHRDLLENLLLCRRFEEKIEKLFLEEGILYGPAHLYLGQEAIAAGVLTPLKDKDYIFSHHRGHAHALAKGIPLKEIMCELFGKKTGTCEGLGGSMHVSVDAEKGALYSSAIVGSNIPMAVGAALAAKRKNEDRVSVSFFGDGAVTTGVFSEGLNMAQFLEVPALFICEDNQYAMSFKTDKVASDIADRAESYEIQTFDVNGNDVLAVYKATQKALDYLRNKSLPVFIEARTYRMKGHGVYDPADYRPEGEAEECLKEDAVPNYKERLLDEEILSKSDIEEIEDRIQEEIEDAVEYAQKCEEMDYKELEEKMEGR